MRVGVFAVGRMKAGPERELAERYFERFGRMGPTLGLEFAGVSEISESRARAPQERRQEESGHLASFLRDGALFLLDERGKNPTSEDFANQIARLRDEGRKTLVCAIGGPDGHDPAMRKSADLVLSLGAQTWPHQLVRVMLAEQLYRAATILSGHPYHRS